RARGVVRGGPGRHRRAGGISRDPRDRHRARIETAARHRLTLPATASARRSGLGSATARAKARAKGTAKGTARVLGAPAGWDRRPGRDRGTFADTTARGTGSPPTRSPTSEGVRSGAWRGP